MVEDKLNCIDMRLKGILMEILLKVKFNKVQRDEDDVISMTINEIQKKYISEYLFLSQWHY